MPGVSQGLEKILTSAFDICFKGIWQSIMLLVVEMKQSNRSFTLPFKGNISSHLRDLKFATNFLKSLFLILKMTRN